MMIKRILIIMALFALVAPASIKAQTPEEAQITSIITAATKQINPLDASDARKLIRVIKGNDFITRASTAFEDLFGGHYNCETLVRAKSEDLPDSTLAAAILTNAGHGHTVTIAQ